jgi:hypothetical protein
LIRIPKEAAQRSNKGNTIRPSRETIETLPLSSIHVKRQDRKIPEVQPEGTAFFPYRNYFVPYHPSRPGTGHNSITAAAMSHGSIKLNR